MFKKSRGRPLIRAIHNKRLFDSENFSSFAKFAFQNKRPDGNIRTTLILSKNIQLLCYSDSSQHSEIYCWQVFCSFCFIGKLELNLPFLLQRDRLFLWISFPAYFLTISSRWRGLDFLIGEQRYGTLKNFLLIFGLYRLSNQTTHCRK